ncbi:MAG TPA: metalloregulator ArsR/SmtB family transcription factor [Candidatus Deferrimicrobium sp.]|nr:metalloregulator ArsR/SmtB family transcription factor [Candidatus Deferrimicrobium sp.]
MKISKALSDPIRYKIIEMLVLMEKDNCCIPSIERGCCSGLCNCDIMAHLGLIQSKVSYHMKELADAGLVYEEQRGKWKYYNLNTKAIKDYITAIEQQFIKQ